MEWQKKGKRERRKLVVRIDEILKLFRNAKRWTKGFFAKDEFNNSVYSDYPGAVCWCLAGAINKVCAESNCRSSTNLLSLFVEGAINQLYPKTCSAITYWNDQPQTTIKDVRSVLRLAKKNVLATLE